jgi:chromosome segregation ATPase
MDHSSTRGPAGPAQASDGRVSHLETLEYDLALSREIRRRLEAETRRLEAHTAALESEVGHLRTVVQERERYLDAIHRSVVWRLAQAVRRPIGRAW